MMGENRAEILKGLESMFRNAREQKLLIRSIYQGILFTSDELEKAQKDGRFIWGITNWELISPQVEYDRLRKVAHNSTCTAEAFRKKHDLSRK